MAVLKIAIYAYFLAILLRDHAVDAKIGVNWGRQQTTKMMPSMVVDLLMQNNVSATKLYNTNTDLIKAFAGSGIEVTVAISNLKDIDNYTKATWVVREKIAKFPHVNIRYLLVGNNALGVARSANGTFSNVIAALELMQQVFTEYGLNDKVKPIISHSFSGVLKFNNGSNLPSDAEFADDIKETIMPAVLNFNRKYNTPFVVDLFPIGLIQIFNVEPDFAFCDHKSKFVITDINGFRYDNIFDFMYDSFAWALKKAGYSDIKITVGQIGWPTDGAPGASAEAAERFWKGLLPKVTSNKGTPMRPGIPIDIFVHSLTDEKQNNVFQPFSRHWGIYRANGQPKYKIDLSGLGRDIYPTSARGLNLMPGRWCVFNGTLSDPVLVRQEFDNACKFADCTSLAPGGSCSMLSFAENISYAFNAYFQSNFQVESACKFNGFGKIIETDPSRDGCDFSVEVVKGNNFSVGRKLHAHNLVLGGSCGMLSFAENISYAFNSYFQNNFRVESACKFNGFGKIVETNPSRDGCVFFGGREREQLQCREKASCSQVCTSRGYGS